MNIIKVNVNFKNGTNYKQGIDTISGDYNSTKMVFTFDREDGTKIFEMKNPDGELALVTEIQNNEIILASYDEENEEYKSIFTEAGTYVYEISLYDGDSKLTSASDKLKVKQEQVEIGDEIAEPYLPVFDELINQVTTSLNSMDEALEEVDNLNISAERVSDGVEISITDKEGQTTTEKVNDGAKGDKGDAGDDYIITPADYNSIANIVKQDIVIPTKTSDLTNDSGFITNVVNNLTNYYLKSQTYTKEEVNNLIGQISSLRLEKVNVLPQTGQNGVVYLVPNAEQEEQNIFNEYIWIDNDWELIGSTKIDLTGYATETWVNAQIADFLTESEITNLVNTALANYYTKGQIDSLLSDKVDSDVLDDYVRNTDYATGNTGGVVKVGSGIYGNAITNDGVIYNVKAENSVIDAKTDNYKPIVSSKLDYAIEKGLGDNQLTWTDTEKSNARTTIGAIGNTDYATSNTGGVIKISPSYSLATSDGVLMGMLRTYDYYKSMNTLNLISKGTLDNVLAGRFVTLTQAQYDALETKDTDAFYYIVEE